MKIFIAQTMDGFIAGEGGSLTHLEPFHGNDYGYESMIAEVGAVILGRRTFDAIVPVHGWTYPSHVAGVVMTSHPLPVGMPPQVIAATDPDEVAARHPDAFIDGGAGTIAQFLSRGLIREMRLFTLPILLGAGVRLFATDNAVPARWRLEEVRSFPCGTVETRYRAAAVGRDSDGSQR